MSSSRLVGHKSGIIQVTSLSRFGSKQLLELSMTQGQMQYDDIRPTFCEQKRHTSVGVPRTIGDKTLWYGKAW